MDRLPPKTNRILLSKPMTVNSGANVIDLITTNNPIIKTMKPRARPLSRLKYLNSKKKPGWDGSSPVLYAKTRVMTAKEIILMESNVIVPATMKL